MYTKFGLNLFIRSQDIEQNPNSDVDLVNDYVYTKFGFNRSICFQDIEKKLKSEVNQGP